MIHRLVVRRAWRSALVATVLLALLAAVATPAASAQEAEAWVDVEVQNVQFATSAANGITHAIATFTLSEPCYDTRIIEDGAGGWLIQAQRQDGTCAQVEKTFVEVINLGQVAPGNQQITINGNAYDFTIEIPTGPWFDVDVAGVEFTTDENGDTTADVSFFTNDPCFNTRVIEDGTGGWLIQAQEQFVVCIQPIGTFTETINLGQVAPGNQQVTINGDDYTFSVEGALAEVLGDVDCDGAMTIVDALMILRYDVGLVADSGPCPRPSTGHVHAATGDINGDGATNAIDALLIARCEAGLIGPGCL